MEYEVTERDEETGQFHVRKIVKKGPTGLITASTRSLRMQMDTRTLEVGISDDEDQTRKVMEAHADAVMPSAAAADVTPFLALQRWLAASGATHVAVPFARTLSTLVPATAVRMRRDFRQLLTCIQTVALLHQKQRAQTGEGWGLAEFADYTIARDLLAPTFDFIMSEGLTKSIRETVLAVGEEDEVALAGLAAKLGIAKSTCSWRVKKAIAGGWLVNAEERKGRPMKIGRGTPLPDNASALPSTTRLQEVFESLFECPFDDSNTSPNTDDFDPKPEATVREDEVFECSNDLGGETSPSIPPTRR